MADQVTLSARELIGGVAEGELLYSDTGLSFWGGVDPVTGVVIDHTHPLKGQCVSGKVLAIPNGRGSCTGSQSDCRLDVQFSKTAKLLKWSWFGEYAWADYRK